MMITSEQCRGARALLDWSREQLADASKVAVRTIIDFERGARAPREVTIEAVQRALEAAGITFLADGETTEGGPGVRLARSKE